MNLLRELIGLLEAHDYYARLSLEEWKERLKKRFPHVTFEVEEGDTIADANGKTVGRYDAQNKTGWVDDGKNTVRESQRRVNVNAVSDILSLRGELSKGVADGIASKLATSKNPEALVKDNIKDPKLAEKIWKMVADEIDE